MNLSRAFKAALWALAIGAAIMCKAALYFVLRGYAVPREWYLAVGILTVIGAVGAALMRRASLHEAAAFADDHFALQDSIVSRKRFAAEERTGGYYDVQEALTSKAVAGKDPARVPFIWPRRLMAGAGVLVLAAGLTAFKSTDQKILDKMAQEELTASNFEDARKLLEQEIEKLEKSADDEEKAELDPQRLQQMVKDLKNTKDLAEAMRQLAALEEKLKEKEKSLDTKKDEALLKKAAEELEKEEDPQARELAKKLKSMELKEAAKDLQKMKPETGDETKKISERRKESARIKAMAKRMAAAARAQKSNSAKTSTSKNQQQKQNQQSQMAKASNTKPGESQQQKDSAAENEQSELAEDMEKLEMEADEYDQELEEMEGLEKLGKLEKGKFKLSKEKGDKLGKLLGKIAGKCNGLGVKRAAKFKLSSLSKKAGQCQGGMGSANLLQMLMAQSGGRKPGTGSVDSRREGKDELTDNGNTTQLKGQKGEGPSLTKIEAADDGTGVSHRKGGDTNRAFKQQYESFVQREDVPEDVKDGVKNYFNGLHAVEPAPAAVPSAPPTGESK